MNISDYILKKPKSYYRFMFSLLITCWGLWTVMPFAFFTSPIHISHYILGTVALILGVAQILLSRFHKNQLSNLPLTRLQFGFWIFLGTISLFANYHSSGWILDYFIALMLGLGYINREFNLD